MHFNVVTDTSGNLPTKLIKENGIIAIPLHYHIDGKAYTCTDTDAFNGDEFYAKMKGGMEVTTSQVTPRDFIAVFEPIVEAGQDVIFISMASGISGTFGAASVAGQQLMEAYPGRKIRVVDAMGASLGEGFVALKAAELRDADMETDAAFDFLKHYSRCMCNIFTVDDLMYLRKGGRLSNLSAVVGTVLNIKPLLKGNEESKIVAFAKIRGRKRSIEALAERYDRLVVEPEKQIVGIAQAGCRQDAEYLVSLLKKNRPPMEILQVEYEPVTGSHVGPGALALFFLSNENVRLEK